MSEVLDIIHRLSYDVDPGGIHSVSQEFNKQITALATLQTALKALEQQLKKTTAEDTAGRAKLNVEIANTKNKIDSVTEAIGKEYAANEKLQQQISGQIGLINQLVLRQQQLTNLRNQAVDTDDIAEYNRQLEETGRELQKLVNLGTNEVGILSQLGAQISDLQGKRLLAGSEQELAVINDQITTLQGRIKELGSLSNTPQAQGPALGEIGRIQEELRKINEQRPFLQTETDIEASNVKVRELQAELQRLGKLGESSIAPANNQFQRMVDLQNKAIAHARELGIRYGVDSQQFEVAANRANNLGKRIQEVNAALVGSGRSANIAAAGFNPLQHQTALLLREVPNLGISLNTFILSLSNNLPYFFDAIKQVNAENRELIANGKPSASVLKQIGQSIFSVQTLLIVGVTLLTRYGSQIVDAFTGGKNAVDLYKESLDEANSAAATEIARLGILAGVLGNEASTRTEVADAIDELRKNYPARFAELEYESKLTSELNESLKEQIDLIKQQAIRTAFTKAYEKSLEDVAKAEQNVLKYARGEVTAGERFLEFLNPLSLLPSTLEDAMADVEKAAKRAEEAQQNALNPGRATIRVIEERLLVEQKELEAIQNSTVGISVNTRVQESNVRQRQRSISVLETYLNKLRELFKLQPADDPIPEISDARALQLQTETELLQIRDQKSKEWLDLAAANERALGSIQEEELIKRYEKERKQQYSTFKNDEKFNIELGNIRAKTQKRIDDLTEKSNKKERDRINQLPYQLLREIEKVQNEIQQVYLRGFVPTEDVIRLRVEAERKAALAELDIRINQAREEKKLNAQTQELFGQLRVLTNQRFDAQILVDKEDFYRKQVEQQRQYIQTIQTLTLENYNKELTLLSSLEKDTTEVRLKIAKAQTDQALAQNSADFDRAIEAREREIQALETLSKSGDEQAIQRITELNKEIEDLTKTYSDRQLTITEQGIRDVVSATEKGLEDRLNQIKTYGTYEENEIKDTQANIISELIRAYENNEISYRKYRKGMSQAAAQANVAELRAQLDAQQKSLDEAKKYYDKLRTDPNATPGDINKARNRVTTAQSAVTGTQQELLGRGDLPSGFQRFMLGDAADAMTDQERFTATVNATADAYQNLANTAMDAWSQINAAQQNALDREVSIRQQRVQMALEIADRGNTEALKQEQEALNASVEEQRKAAITQQAINSALTISNALVAVAKAAAQGGGFGSIAAVLAVIGALATGYAAVQSFSAANNNQFWTGGFTPEGGKYQPVGTVHAGEFVANQETTRKYRRELAAMHNGTYPLMPAQPKIFSGGDGYATKGELIGIAAKLDGVTEAIEGLSFRAENRVDGSGVNQLVETQVKIRQRQWRR